MNWMPATPVGRTRGACLAVGPSQARGPCLVLGRWWSWPREQSCGQLQEVAPDLERIPGEALLGTIWHRDALSPVQREMITLSTLLVLARETQLRRHLGHALHIGLTPEQMVELMIHDTWYGGAPAGLERAGPV